MKLYEDAETKWDALLFTVVISGIAAKLQSGEAMTEAQQAVKDMAPPYFRWPVRNEGLTL